MTNSCASCFYSFTAPTDADPPSSPSRVGKLFCNRNAPSAQSNNPNTWLWPLVQDDFWCGEGADDQTGLSFAAPVNGNPGTGGTGAGYTATSTTNLTIANTGSVSPDTQAGLAYTAGARVRLASRAGSWMEGILSAYASGTGAMTVALDSSSGSGSHTDWDINLAGQPGISFAAKGTFTCSNSVSTGVTEPAVLGTSVIILTPTNAAASKLIRGANASGKGLYVASIVSGSSFTVSTDDAAAAAGTETFNYIVVN